MERPFRKRVAVIGAGAAGLMAAICAAEGGAEVTLVERNSRPGRKIGITGKGRCNVTNAADLPDILKNVVSHPRFLYSALYGFPNTEVMRRLEEAGVPLKVERGGRVFPVSDSARDIIDALVGMAAEKKVGLRTGIRVTGIEKQNGIWKVESPHQTLEADALILATGGRSYTKTGSEGDGYGWARKMGHHVTNLRPGLVPLVVEESWVKALQGLSLRNVRIRITDVSGTKIHEDFGEMLFTHFGVSGPLILSASSLLQKYVSDRNLDWKEAGLTLHIDLKPALNAQQLDRRLLRDLEEYRAKQMQNALEGLLPSRLICTVLQQSGIRKEQKAGELTKEQRAQLAGTLKDLKCPLAGPRPLEEAIITMGGVDVSEIDPKTMESKKIDGLYFAGEIIDVDALTGGYNLQIAFSTGAAAGRAASRI